MASAGKDTQEEHKGNAAAVATSVPEIKEHEEQRNLLERLREDRSIDSNVYEPFYFHGMTGKGKPPPMKKEKPGRVYVKTVADIGSDTRPR